MQSVLPVQRWVEKWEYFELKKKNLWIFWWWGGIIIPKTQPLCNCNGRSLERWSRFSALYFFTLAQKILLENFSRKFFFLQWCLPVTAAEWVSPLCCLQIALSGFEPTNAWPDFDKNLILILIKTSIQIENKRTPSSLAKSTLWLWANQCMTRFE